MVNNNHRGRVTLRDVAQYANVSASTVSRALNNHEHVHEVTRAAIQKAVEELNYPLEKLRGKTAAQKTILLLSRGDFAEGSSDISFGPNFEKLVSDGVRAVLEAKECDVVLQHSYMSADDARTVVKNFKGAGVIVLGGLADLHFVRVLQESNIPLVIAGSHYKPLPLNWVMADIIYGMEQAVAHLVERGRQKIGLVNSSSMTKTSDEKLKGLRLALHEFGLPFSPEQVIGSRDYDLEAGYRQTLELLNRAKVDAIIYGHDVMATGGLHALKERGYKIPDDIAVVGFLDYQIARFANPPLTTIRVDMPLMGMIAARRLCMMIDEPDGQNWSMLVPTELVVRESTRRKAQ
jgi:LacI family transcriptional regulator